MPTPASVARAESFAARSWAAVDPERAGELEREAADVRERLGRPRPGYQDTWVQAPQATS